MAKKHGVSTLHLLGGAAITHTTETVVYCCQAPTRMTWFCACVRWNLHLTFWSFSGKKTQGPSYFLWQPRMLSLFALRLTLLDVEKNLKPIPLKVHLLRVSPLLLIPEIHEMATWIHKQLSNKTDHKVKTENWITKNDFLSQIRRVIQIA